MNEVYLCLGGNLGDRKNNLKKAVELINYEIGEVILQSKIYETASWGIESQANYLNQVIKIKSDQGPKQLLDKALSIEEKIGRTRTIKWESRLIDIDILFFNNEIIQQEGLMIPHPYLQDRKFVLIPLVEIAPFFAHPISKLTMTKLLAACNDELLVRMYCF